MKIKNLFLGLLGVVTLTLSSCDNEADLSMIENTKTVSFSASVGSPLTRATATKWESGDAIGVYALNDGKKLASANVYDGKENIKYTTTSTGTSGSFTAAEASKAIKLPGSGDKLDFVAYYPYAQTVSDYKVAVDVSNQTDLTAIDFLYATKAGVSKNTSTTVNLTFNHKLSRVVIELKKEGTISLDGAKIKFKNAITDAKLVLKDGTVEKGSNKADVEAKMDDTAHTGTVILIPGQKMSELAVEVKLTDGKTYSWTPIAAKDYTLESGKSAKYVLTLTEGNVNANVNGSGINNWDNAGGNGQGTGTLDPQTTSFTTDKTELAFTSAAGDDNVKITANPNTTTWTAVSSETWAKVSPANGTGSGDLKVSVEENTASTERTATVTITPNKGKAVTVTVKQAGKQAAAQGTTTVEKLDNSNLTKKYKDDSFVGVNGITWTYVQSRDENEDKNGSGIDGKAIMLRSEAKGSKITSSTISKGIKSFSVKMYKGYTGKGNRQIEVFINGESKGKSEKFDDNDAHTFKIDNINISGDFTIEIKNVTSKQVIIDDITWESME